MCAYIMSFIWEQVVRGLGETLVGAYPGRALSFVCKKNDLNSPQVCKSVLFDLLEIVYNLISTYISSVIIEILFIFLFFIV